MNDRTRGGRTLARWKGQRGLRLQVLRRAGFHCEVGLPGCTGRATSVHIAPWLMGDHRLATLETSLAVCHHCHGRVDGGRSRGGRGKLARYVVAVPRAGHEVPATRTSERPLLGRRSATA